MEPELNNDSQPRAPEPMHSAPLRRRSLLAAAGLLTLPGVCGAGAANPQAQLAAVVADPRWPLAGLSVYSVAPGRPPLAAQFGQAHYAPDRPITSDTLFRVASLSKLITGLGALRLAEAGKLDLDADISDVLGVRVRNPAFDKEPIRVHHLMSHLSSLRDEGGIAFAPGIKLADELARPASKSWAGEHAPGEYFSYCNLNYGVLASVMERAAGQRFDELMQHWVLTPLAMQGGFNGMALSDAQKAQIATLYRRQRVQKAADAKGEDQEVWDLAAPWSAQTDDLDAKPLAPIVGLDDSYRPGDNGTLFGPQGGLRTRVADLGRVLEMLLADGTIDGRRFLARKSIERMFAETWRHEPSKANGDTLDGLFQAWGTGAQHFIDRSAPGWGDRLVPAGGAQAWGHLGFAYGLEAALLLDRKTRRGAVYVLNGHSAEPTRHRGTYSSFPLWQERLNGLLL